MSTPNFKLNSSSRRNRKPLIAVLIIAVLIASGVGSYMFIKNRNAENSRVEQKARDEAQTNNAKKVVEDKNATDAQSKNLPNNSTSTTSDNVPTSEELKLTITSTSQKDGTVSASASVTGAASDGTCVFTYSTPEDKPVVQQVASVNNVCKSNIPEVQFSKLGSWNLKVVFYLNNVKSEANQNVTIN